MKDWENIDTDEQRWTDEEVSTIFKYIEYIQAESQWLQSDG